jgi:hypothetical protein
VAEQRVNEVVETAVAPEHSYHPDARLTERGNGLVKFLEALSEADAVIRQVGTPEGLAVQVAAFHPAGGGVHDEPEGGGGWRREFGLHLARQWRAPSG